MSSWPSMACNPMSVTRFSGFFRDCVSGEILLARSLLSATIAPDLATLLSEVPRRPSPVPITGVISESASRRSCQAVAQELPRRAASVVRTSTTLREAARPIYEADRHAKKELKKRIPGRTADRMRSAEADADDARGRLGSGLLRQVRSRLDRRRRATAAGGLGVALPARAAGNHRRCSLDLGRGFGGDIAGRAEETAAVAATRPGRNGRVMAAGAWWRIAG